MANSTLPCRLANLTLLGLHGEGSTFPPTTRGLAGHTVREKRLLRKGVKRWTRNLEDVVEVVEVIAGAVDAVAA